MSIADRDTRAPRSALSLVLPVLAGLAAGLGSSLFFAQPARSTDARPARAESAESTPAKATRSEARSPAAAVSPAMAARLDALEQKVSEMKPEEAPEAAADPEEREEQRRLAREVYETTLETHEHAPVNPAWARGAQDSLGAAMTGIAQAHGGKDSVKSVDCKTDSCLATIEFPSFIDARAGYGAYVSEAYELNCARFAMLDPPEDPAAPYDVRVIFHGCRSE